MGLSVIRFPWQPHSPAGAAWVIFTVEFSRLGLIAVFVLVFCVSGRAKSQHRENINHANHMLHRNVSHLDRLLMSNMNPPDRMSI